MAKTKVSMEKIAQYKVQNVPEHKKKILLKLRENPSEPALAAVEYKDLFDSLLETDVLVIYRETTARPKVNQAGARPKVNQDSPRRKVNQ